MSEHLLTHNNIEFIYHDYGPVSTEEAAGAVAAIVGAVAYVVGSVGSAVAAGAMAVSSVVTAGIAAVGVSGGIATTLGGIIGNAAMGAVISAGVAYASGARGAQVWRAAGMGGLTAGVASGLSALSSGGASAAGSASGAATAAPAATTGAPSVLGTTTATGTATGATAGSAVGGATAATTASPSLMTGIRQIFGNVDGTTLNRISSVLINAAVNHQSMGRLDGLVAQQRAELEALRQSDTNAYNIRIANAQKMLDDADRWDPSWYARARMADVAGMEATQFKQAMRNIAVRQGGSLDTGQAKAYERGHALWTARSKALAYNEGFTQASQTQEQLRASGAQLMGPNEAAFQNINAQSELLAAQNRAHQEADNSTWGGIAAGLFGENYKPATSPDPSARNEDDSNSFANGLFHPFGGAGGGHG